MSQGSDWPLHLWVGGFAVALMVGAASLGGSAWDWLERTRGHVVVVDHWQGVHVSRSVEAFMRDPGAG